MKYIRNYKLFESDFEIVKRWDDLTLRQKVGQLLYLYGAIPIARDEALDVIGLILKKRGDNFNIFNYKDIDFRDISYWEHHNILRFNNYFNALVSNKPILGFNFEGTICGFFNGKLSELKSSKHDIVIDDKKFSLKCTNKKESLTLGTFKQILEKTNKNVYDDFNKSDDKNLATYLDNLDEKIQIDEVDKEFLQKTNKREIITNLLKYDPVDYYIFSYINNDNESEKHVICNVISMDGLIDFIVDYDGLLPSTKGTSPYQLRLSALVHDHIELEKKSSFKFIFKEITGKDVESLRPGDLYKWAKKILNDNDVIKKIRPDVIDYIKTNKKLIRDNLSDDIDN